MNVQPRLAGATVEPAARRALTVEWDDGRRSTLNVLWLRDNCPGGGDKLSAIRTFSLAELDPDLTIAAAAPGDGSLVVDFSDGHRSVFDDAWLRARAGRGGQPMATEVIRWRSGTALPVTAFASLDEPDTHRRLLEALVTHGAALVEGVPIDDAASESLADRLGPVRETDFGRFFDIVSEPHVWELSQSTEALDPHTDDPYRYTPSGMSILHCIEAGADGGGRSSLVDGFEVAESIRAERPDDFELLASVSVPWVRYRADAVDQGAAVNLRAEAPVIKLDPTGAVCGIRFHERSLGTLELEPELADRYYRAVIEFVRRIRDAGFQWQHQLVPGEALVFDNQRVLHGRTAFTGDTGRRHLRLCTVDRENVHSKLRLLRERCGAGGVDDRLPAGNLS